MIRLDEIVIEQPHIRIKIAVNGTDPSVDRQEVQLTGIGGVGKLSSSDTGIPKISYEDEPELLEHLQLLENCEYDFSISIPVTQEVYLTERRARPAFPFSSDSIVNVVTFNSTEAFATDDQGRLRVTGRLNFKDRAGAANLSTAAGNWSLPLAVEVRTSKLTYITEYRAIMRALADFSSSLLLRLDTGVETALGMSDQNSLSPLAEIIHLRRLFQDDRLPQFLAMIMANPSLRVMEYSKYDDLAFCPEPDFTEIASNPAAVTWIKRNNSEGYRFPYIPAKLHYIERTRTHDTPENRFVKHMAEVLIQRLQRVLIELPDAYRASRVSAARWLVSLEELMVMPFWREVRSEARYPNSMLLVQRQGYREFTQDMVALSLGLALETDAALSNTAGELKPVFELYELWCFLQIYHALERLTGSQGTPGIRFVQGERGYSFSFQHNAARPTVFQWQSTTGTAVGIELYYNRQFDPLRADEDNWHKSYSAQLKPDISLCISSLGISHWVHFDAKYKLDHKKLMAQLESEDTQGDDAAPLLSTYKRIDLHTMHTYRDALLGTRGSYVLYPGKEEKPDVFVRHGLSAYRLSNALPSIGAFPLIPDDQGVGRQLDQLVLFLETLCNALSSTGNYQEELAFQPNANAIVNAAN